MVCGEEEIAVGEFVLYMPDADDDSLNFIEIEGLLQASLEASGAGRWEGRGYDLQLRRTDTRFHGPDPVKIAEVLLPILRMSKLPRGSLVMVGGKRPRQVNAPKEMCGRKTGSLATE